MSQTIVLLDYEPRTVARVTESLLPIGNALVPDVTLALAAGDVLGRPGMAWTGSSIMIAWASRDGGDLRNVAILDAGGEVASTGQAAATDIGPSMDVAWASSHAAVVWVEGVAGDPEVVIGLYAGDGTPEGLPVRITTSAGAASAPVVDADDSAILAAWVDSRSGADEVRLAVMGHDGSMAAADAAVPSSAGGSSPAVSVAHRMVAWIDPGAGTPTARTSLLDASWIPSATPVDVAPAGGLALASSPGRLLAALGGDFATLGEDGAAVGSTVALGADAVSSMAWGVISAAGVGASPPGGPPGVLLALAGCAQHDDCTSWAPGIAPVATRTGRDEIESLVVHDAATSGSWASRPVTYLSIQFFQAGPRDGPDIPGGYLLTGVPYESCGLCVLVYENCGTSTCERTYLARGGHLDLESIGPAGTVLAGSLVDVQLAEVTIDSSDGSSSWVPGGREICLGGYEFSQIIAPY